MLDMCRLKNVGNMGLGMVDCGGVTVFLFFTCGLVSWKFF